MYIEKPIPFYMAYPLPYLFDGEQEQERDRQVMQSFYSQKAAKIQELAEEECDRMEYEGSMMFDEYPDKFMMEQVCRGISEKMSRNEENTQIMEDDGLRDLIGVILYNEMFRRRCKRRKCRRYF